MTVFVQVTLVFVGAVLTCVGAGEWLCDLERKGRYGIALLVTYAAGLSVGAVVGSAVIYWLTGDYAWE